MTPIVSMESFGLSLILWVMVLALASARTLACAAFLPFLSNRYMGALPRHVVCLMLSLPQTWHVWTQVNRPGGEQLLSATTWAWLGIKEVMVGAILGFLMSWPITAFQSAFTLIDNQRGANAAQLANPSLQADASILGELAGRVLIVFLIATGAFLLVFDVMANSYVFWPVLSGLPDWPKGVQTDVFKGFTAMLATMLVYASPVLLLLLCIEFCMAVASTSVQGLDVYQTAMPIKSLCALVVIVLYLPALLRFANTDIEHWWLTGLLGLLGRHE